MGLFFLNGLFFYPLLDGEKSSNKKQMKILRKYRLKKKEDFFSLFEKVEAWETDFWARPEDKINFKGKFRLLSFIWYIWHSEH